jgi:hypothetical protein
MYVAMKIILAVVAGLEAIFLLTLCSNRTSPKAEPARYELHKAGGELPFVFVFEPATGRTWRYWFNTTTHAEGLSELIYNNPPLELRAEKAAEITPPHFDLQPFLSPTP